MYTSLNIKFLLGNFLIISSILLFILIYYPILSIYFFPTKLNLVNLDDYIQIPKINAQAQIISNVDPWNKEIYEKALEKGVAQAIGFDNFLFAHSSLAPWKMTRTNTPFLRLGELRADDEITIHKDGKNSVYKVVDKKVVWPNEMAPLLKRGENELILQTCTPLGTDLKRLLIFAKLT